MIYYMCQTKLQIKNIIIAIRYWAEGSDYYKLTRLCHYTSCCLDFFEVITSISIILYMVKMVLDLYSCSWKFQTLFDDFELLFCIPYYKIIIFFVKPIRYEISSKKGCFLLNDLLIISTLLNKLFKITILYQLFFSNHLISPFFFSKASPFNRFHI